MEINIPGTNLRRAAIDPTFKKALAAMLIIKFRYGDSSIHDFSFLKLRKLLRCDYKTAVSIYDYLIDNGHAEPVTKKNGEKRLTLFKFIVGEPCIRIALSAEKTSTGGLYFYISNGQPVKAIEDNSTLTCVERLIDEACLLNNIYLLLTRKGLIERKKATKKCLSELSVRSEELKKKEDANRKSELVKRISPLAQYCPEEVKKNKKLFAGTNGFDYSIYAIDGISQQQLVKWCFGDTLSLNTVKRRLKSLIDKGLLAAHRHGRVVAERFEDDFCDEDNGDFIISALMHHVNVFGEECPYYRSKRAKFLYNNCRENKEAIAKDHNKAAYCAWWQPWPNSYTILCSVAIKDRRRKKRKGGKTA